MLDEKNDDQTPKDGDVGIKDVVHRPHPAVVHVADEEMTYQLSIDWHELLADADGRQSMIDWLRRNDPMIANVYSRIEMSGIRGPEADRAVLLILVKAMRSRVPRVR